MNLWRRPAAWAAAALLLTGVGSGAWALGLLPGAPSCGGSSLRITIAARPEIAPALSDVADRFNVEEHRVSGRCVDAHVTATARTDLLGDAPLRAMADAWVPESSLWLDLARDADLTVDWELLRKDEAGGFGLARAVPDPRTGMTKAALGTGSARDNFQQAGFRAPDGALTPAYADEHHLPETAPPSLRVPTRKEIDNALTSWEA